MPAAATAAVAVPAPPSQPAGVAVSSDAVAPVADPFVASVRPVLLRRCAPCHEPGGKMYARMPFDDPAVVRSSSEGLLRRLKEPDERAALEAWLGQP